MEARTVTGGPDLETVRELFREYSEQIGTDLCFQGFAAELASLPGDYASPGGTLLLGVHDGVVAGCVAVRRWDADSCEMKRLYVRPALQGSGIGRFLTDRAIQFAGAHGYKRVVLDTLPTMVAAQRMYERLGFVDIEPYRANPVPGARYMALTIPEVVVETLMHEGRMHRRPSSPAMRAKARNVFLALLGVLVLVLKGYYAGPFQEAIRSYGGNVAASFSTYYVVTHLFPDRRFRVLLTGGLALAVVELFEAFDGFGVMANVYDRVDYAANAVGVALAVAVDSVTRRIGGRPPTHGVSTR